LTAPAVKDDTAAPPVVAAAATLRSMLLNIAIVAFAPLRPSANMPKPTRPAPLKPCDRALPADWPDICLPLPAESIPGLLLLDPPPGVEPSERISGAVPEADTPVSSLSPTLSRPIICLYPHFN